MTSLQTIGLTFLGLLAGMSFALQSTVNSQLRGQIDSPFWAAFISYLGGTLVMALVLLFTRSAIPSTFSQTSWVSWTGGLFGSIYVVCLILLLPRFGSAPTFGLLIAGQLLTAMAFDQFGLFGLVQRSISPLRILGAILLILGAVLVRSF